MTETFKLEVRTVSKWLVLGGEVEYSDIMVQNLCHEEELIQRGAGGCVKNPVTMRNGQGIRRTESKTRCNSLYLPLVSQFRNLKMLKLSDVGVNRWEPWYLASFSLRMRALMTLTRTRYSFRCAVTEGFCIRHWDF